MEKLTFKEKYSYGIGAYGKDLVYWVVSTFLMFYLTDTVGLNPAFVGTLFLAARLWDTVNDPIMGMIVDNTRTKWGKFRPWIFIGTILNAVTLIFLFKKPVLEGGALYAYYSAMYILWGMTYTIMDIPYWSMIPALSSDKEEREKISVIPRIFASFGALTITTFGLTLIAKLGGGNDLNGYTYLAIGISAIFIVTEIITCINVSEKTEVPKNNEKINVKQLVSIIKGNDQLLVFIGIVLSMNLITQLAGGVGLYYFKYVEGSENLFSVFNGFSGVAEITGLMLFPLLTKRIGRQKVFKIASILPVLGLLLLFTTSILLTNSIIFVAISAIIFKLGYGLLLGSTTVMLADIVDYGQYKLGTRNESIIFSVQTLLVKSASAISGWLIGVGLSSIGYVAGAAIQTDATITGIRITMTILPATMAIIMFIIYKFKYKINGKYHDEILEGLSEAA